MFPLIPFIGPSPMLEYHDALKTGLSRHRQREKLNTENPATTLQPAPHLQSTGIPGVCLFQQGIEPFTSDM